MFYFYVLFNDLIVISVMLVYISCIPPAAPASGHQMVEHCHPAHSDAESRNSAGACSSPLLPAVTREAGTDLTGL